MVVLQREARKIYKRHTSVCLYCACYHRCSCLLSCRDVSLLGHEEVQTSRNCCMSMVVTPTVGFIKRRVAIATANRLHFCNYAVTFWTGFVDKLRFHSQYISPTAKTARFQNSFYVRPQQLSKRHLGPSTHTICFSLLCFVLCYSCSLLYFVCFFLV